MARSTMEGEVENTVALSHYTLLQGCCTFVVFLSKNRLQTLATLVHATGGEDRTPHRTQHARIFFSLRAV